MGAQEFTTYATGNSAADAFKNAVDDAKFDYGHAGYSGTIAEKTSFTEIPTPDAGITEEIEAQFEDKWGPAGCFKVKNHEDTWCFFGWASS